MKDPLSMEEKSGVRHKIPLNCQKIYIGETETDRPWGTRMNEHDAYMMFIHTECSTRCSDKIKSYLYTTKYG